ncbi:MAG: hypothetical protein EU531_00880 [Promethearchaeota archaeon]|nr:MAG: hypothetical protein EU531_00880 [Candidatus Lokiarchaeota archaeon]
MLSEILFNTFALIFALFIIIILGVGFFLLVRGIQIKMCNIIIAAIAFIGLPIGFIGNVLFNLGGFFQEIFIFIAFNFTVVFTNLTFYKRKKVYPTIVFAIVFILGVIQIALHALPLLFGINVYYLRVSLDLPYTLLTFNWLAWAAFQSYNRLNEYIIAPWVKLRYKLIAVFSFLISFNSIPEFFQPKGVYWGDPDNITSLIIFGITAILAISFSLGFFIAWIMPNWLKKKINKNYKPLEDKEYSEEELMEMIKTQLDDETRSNK